MAEPSDKRERLRIVRAELARAVHERRQRMASLTLEGRWALVSLEGSEIAVLAGAAQLIENDLFSGPAEKEPAKHD